MLDFTYVPLVGVATAILWLVVIFVLIYRDSDRYFSIPPDADEELIKRMRSLQNYAPIILIFGTTAVFLFIIYFVDQLALKQHEVLKYAEFVIYSPTKNLYLPIGFLSLMVLPYILRPLYILVFGRKAFSVYIYLDNNRGGFDTWNLLRSISYLIVPSCLIAILLTINHYVLFTKSDLIINPFFTQTEVRLSYKYVEKLQYVKRFHNHYGDVRDRSYYQIVFLDGRVLKFNELLYTVSLSQQKQIMQFISQQTSIPIKSKGPFRI